MFASISFKTKLLLVVSVIGTLVLTSALIFRWHQTDILLKERMLLRTGTVADFAVKGWTADGVKAYVGWLAQGNDIQYAAFFSAKGELLYFAGQGNQAAVKPSGEDIFNLKDATYDVSRPVLKKTGEQAGTLVLGFPMARLYSDSRGHTMAGLLVWFIAIALIVASMYFALSHFLAPLKDIYTGAQRLAEKNLSYRIPVTSSDEFGYTAAQFNAMATELDSFYMELQKKVSSATSELHKANGILAEKNLQLETLNARLKELDQRKTEVISIVSHDLRTPLTSIIGFADTLLNKDLDFSAAERARYIGIINTEAHRLARLISDFLVVTKIEEGVYRLAKEHTDLCGLLSEAAAPLNLAPKELKLRLELPERPVMWEVDRDKLLQVIHNLLGNAIKYSPTGGTLSLALRESGGTARISVSDTGHGIPDEEKEKVFDKFYRRNDAVARKEFGTGLGLAIAKSIVELHGGKIAVKDSPSGGCEFFFELPASAQDAMSGTPRPGS